MTNTPWKPKSSTDRREHMVWPTPVQMLRQIGIVATASIAWVMLLAGFMALSGTPEPLIAAAKSEPERGTESVPPTFTPALVALATSEPTEVPTKPPATATPPAPTDTPVPTASATPSVAASASAPTVTAPVSSPTPTPEPTATVTRSAPTATRQPPATATKAPAPTTRAQSVSFAGDVLPILERRCVKCHGGEKVDGEMDVKSYAGLMKGSENGPMVDPGNAADSRFVQQLITGEMPKKAPRLLPAEIRVITEWVNAGAPDN